ncbi:uncharacterized protein LOC108628730 [Ceratina calcarata]|uniref:Uncharacterized protein LOC108628730 n=1 Tax=Ceratina calcarata TaxID=156304 RepID=A0AAJ7NAY3_9HYME|nr:uncharacterized protein LOC108628730 [Ceratina calcarata]
MINKSIDEQIIILYGEQKWKDIVDLNLNSYKFDKGRLCWVLPTINDLHWLKEVIDEHNVGGLASIGCGCGLFEWLFQKYSGSEVIGVELDRSWWRSKYSPPVFLTDVIFVLGNESNDRFLSGKYALLFCYFNNGAAFRDYIENYKGNLILVIGPKPGENRWTDPMPFDLKKFHDHGWKLTCERKMERTRDYITAYTKI